MQSHATETNQILWFYSFFRFSIWKNYFQLSALPLFTLLRGPWDTYCCTVVYMHFNILKNVVTQPTNMFVLREFMFYLYLETELVFVFWTGVYIFVLKLTLIFCTGIHIVVHIVVLLYCCTGKYTRIANEYLCVLRYRMQ